MIGAGVSGLSVASLLAKAGYSITVFEKSDGAGLPNLVVGPTWLDLDFFSTSCLPGCVFP